MPRIQSQVIVFDADTTNRWPCSSGDFVLWVRCTDFLTARFRLADYWQMQDGDSVLITNRLDDVPGWLELQPDELRGMAVYQMMEKLNGGFVPSGEKIDAPTIWRACAGERLVWIGAAGDTILDLRADVLCVVESDRADFDPLDMMNSNGLDSQEARLRLNAGYEAVWGLGVPRVHSLGEWRLG